MLSKLIFTILTAALLTFAGTTTSMADLVDGCGNGPGICDGTGDGDGNRYGHNYGDENGIKDGSCIVDEDGISTASTGLTPEEIEWLLFTREEEKLARDSYLVLGALLELAIFDNIAVAEQKHMDAMKKLLDCYKLTDPVIDELGTFTNPELQTLFDFLMVQGTQTVMDGLYAGALIEETDIKSLQDAIIATVHTDIASTYESLMCGSRNHLRAFVRQIEINGGSYTPTVLTEDDSAEFWAIAHSDMEQNCGKNRKW